MSQESDSVKNSGNLPQSRSILLVALGSNMDSAVGSPTETLRLAVAKLQSAGGVIRARSRLFRTPAFPPGSGPDFVNAAIAVEAPWTAREAISQLHAVEAEIGRRRRARWEARTIDLDLIARGEEVRPDTATLRRWMDLPLQDQQARAPGELILPHPRMHERAFVLVPLADVAPGWTHPVLRRTVTAMRDALPRADLEAVVPLPEPWE